MHFTGRIYFSFDTYDVWRLYSTVLKASQVTGVTVDVEWRPFLAAETDEPTPPEHIRGLAACELVRNSYPAEYDRFARALLTLSYQEKDDPGSDQTLAVAAHVAGIDGDQVTAGTDKRGGDLLARASDDARQLGVAKAPTIVRQGPPVYIKTSGAANYGDSVARLELINRMLDDDGIWTLSKP